MSQFVIVYRHNGQLKWWEWRKIHRNSVAMCWDHPRPWAMSLTPLGPLRNLLGPSETSVQCPGTIRDHSGQLRKFPWTNKDILGSHGVSDITGTKNFFLMKYYCFLTNSLSPCRRLVSLDQWSITCLTSSMCDILWPVEFSLWDSNNQSGTIAFNSWTCKLLQQLSCNYGGIFQQASSAKTDCTHAKSTSIGEIENQS